MMTMNIEEIRQLSADLKQAGLCGAEIEKPGFKLTLKLGSAHAPPSAAPDPTTPEARPCATLLDIKAPSLGRFLDAHPDDNLVLAPMASDVVVGQLVALLAIGSLLLPVRSQHAGKVCSQLVSSGTAVGYGQTLISLCPVEAGAMLP
jgi:acetyl-CoA carboxylase biotin carboxyl carrier protein